MLTVKIPIYQSQQIRQFEQLAEERFNISPKVLMDRAGKAAFNFLVNRFPNAKKIAVFCGSGNNGGDGYVLALAAHEQGLKVIVWQIDDEKKLKSQALEALAACRKANLPIKPFNEKVDLEHPDVIVDAICGIGVHQNLREDVIKAIEKIQSVGVPIVAIDIPTGIDADTGQSRGVAQIKP